MNTTLPLVRSAPATGNATLSAPKTGVADGSFQTALDSSLEEGAAISGTQTAGKTATAAEAVKEGRSSGGNRQEKKDGSDRLKPDDAAVSLAAAAIPVNAPVETPAGDAGWDANRRDLGSAVPEALTSSDRGMGVGSRISGGLSSRAGETAPTEGRQGTSASDSARGAFASYVSANSAMEGSAVEATAPLAVAGPKSPSDARAAGAQDEEQSRAAVRRRGAEAQEAPSAAATGQLPEGWEAILPAGSGPVGGPGNPNAAWPTAHRSGTQTTDRVGSGSGGVQADLAGEREVVATPVRDPALLASVAPPLSFAQGGPAAPADSGAVSKSAFGKPVLQASAASQASQASAGKAGAQVPPLPGFAHASAAGNAHGGAHEKEADAKSGSGGTQQNDGTGAGSSGAGIDGSGLAVHKPTVGDGTLPSVGGFPGALTARSAEPTMPARADSAGAGSLKEIGQPAALEAAPVSLPGPVNTARVLEKMSGTEMRLGMHSAEFGSISIATSVSQGGVQAQIALDHGALGKALAAHLPGVEEKLGSAFGVSARVEVRDGSGGALTQVGNGGSGGGAFGGAGAFGGGGAPAQGGGYGRSGGNALAVPQLGSAAGPAAADSGEGAFARAGSGGRLSVHA